MRAGKLPRNCTIGHYCTVGRSEVPTFTFICHPGKTPTSGPVETHRGGRNGRRYQPKWTVSQSVSYFTVPPRAHPSTGSQSGSATPGLTQVPSTQTHRPTQSATLHASV